MNETNEMDRRQIEGRELLTLINAGMKHFTSYEEREKIREYLASQEAK